MDERTVIERTKGLPATVDSLASDLAGLGVRPGDVLIIHSSLSALGWVCGGAVAVIEALERAVGPTGTLVMPTQSGGLTDPLNWRNPPVPEEWKDLIRQTMPAYDPARTPTHRMGAVAETFRTWPGAVRSRHPFLSFVARGPRAKEICAEHSLDFGLGEGSPLARVYDLDGFVLLLGVGHASNTSLHLAEHRARYPSKRETTSGAPILVDGSRAWIATRDLGLSCDDFVELGAAFGAEPGNTRTAKVGAGIGLLMRQRALVDFAVQWMETHRGPARDLSAIHVRDVTAPDRAEWVRLRHSLWPRHNEDELGAEIDRLLADQGAATFVAEVPSGHLCGVIEVALRDAAEGCTTHPVGYIEGWYVDPEFRGRGVGCRLAEAGEAWARSRGCVEMASDTTPEYPDGPAAHAAAGYHRVLVTFHFRKSL